MQMRRMCRAVDAKMTPFEGSGWDQCEAKRAQLIWPMEKLWPHIYHKSDPEKDAQIKASFEERGLIWPIKIGENGVIVEGSRVFRVMQEKGYKYIGVEIWREEDFIPVKRKTPIVPDCLRSVVGGWPQMELCKEDFLCP